MLLLLLACSQATDDTGDKSAGPEPLDLPADPAADGVPVGITTVEANGQVIEVWYPASDTVGGSTELADFEQFLPSSVTDVVGPIEFPPVDTHAHRDAALRVPESPYPVIVFSHGFGGMRLQSLDYAEHLASRGYVVAAADHPGRMLGDLLPCMFSPALEGCDLSGMTGDDPAVEDVIAVADWVEAAATDGMFAGAIDPTRMALSGHSAGGGTVQDASEADPRFSALLSMAAGAAPSGDNALLLMDGTCDGIVPDSSVVAAQSARPASTLVQVVGAGHLAFSDLCALELRTLGEELLAPREDVNQALLNQLFQLASDGCPDGTPAVEACADTGYLPLEDSAPLVRGYSTAWFDQQLRGQGGGVADIQSADTVVTAPSGG